MRETSVQLNSVRTSIEERLRSEVQPERGLIPSWVHADPAVYDLELERIFGRGWNFVAHTSELDAPDAFVTRRIGRESVIVTKTGDAEYTVLLNVCTHRGMRLCQEDRGTAKRHRCAYHGFSFATDGQLLAVPYEKDAYGELDKERLHLQTARVEVYQGMIFATWNQEGPSLLEHLGDLAWYLDIMVGRADMEVVGPPQRWRVPTAWKFPAENFVTDAYHTATTHAFLARLKLVDGIAFGRDGVHVSPGQGHGLGIGLQDDGPWYPEELTKEIGSHLTSEQLSVLDRIKNFHGNCFPNLSFLIPNVIEVGGKRVTGTTLRLWQPLSATEIEVWSWFLVERNAPQWWKDLGRKTYIQTFGASGQFEQDDTENWEAQTLGAEAALSAGRQLSYDISMGKSATPAEEFPGPGLVLDGKFSEAAARDFYRRWLHELVSEGAT